MNAKAEALNANTSIQTVEVAIVVSQIPDENAGIAMGANFSLSGYGAFGMLLISCKNAFDAIKTGVKYQKLTYLYGSLSLSMGKKDSALCYQPSHLPDYLMCLIIDRDISGTYRLIEELRSFMNISMPIKALWLPYPEPKDISAHKARYPFPIRFNQTEARFIFANDELQRPFPSASDTAFELYKKQCDELVKSLTDDNDTISDAVKTHLGLFFHTYPNAAQVAETLGFSERSLRRRLNNEGNSFQQLLDECKFSKARHYLKQSNDSIDAIAERLGYTESGSFIRAFQRWAGETPAKFRKAQH